jgi:DNA helicase-2/ATP-dependent DNA helicase PcrA
MSLNPEQEQAASHVDGPCLVTACPGSGKTRTIQERTSRLVNRGIPPHAILSITFTNKAAEEMRERIGKSIGDAAKRMEIRTFHGLAARLLRKNGSVLGYDPNITILDDGEQVDLLAQCARALGHEMTKPAVKKLLVEVNDSRENLENSSQMYARMKEFDPSWYQIGEEYIKRLKENNSTDFSGLLSETVALLENKEVLDKIHRWVKYLQVDEVQDTNIAQMKIAETLVEHTRNIFVVGDLDQCVVEGEKVLTTEGYKPVEDCVVGDRVISGSGKGGTRGGLVTVVKKIPVTDRGVVTITTASGKSLTVTEDHKVFAGYRLSGPPLYFVYLMYKAGLGFRIGVTQRHRNHDARNLGYAIRLNQEKADALWLLGSYPSESEARFWEHMWSIEYGIPTWLFHVEGRKSAYNQSQINKMFDLSGSTSNGVLLLKELGMDFYHPLHVSESSTGQTNFVITQCGDSRYNTLHRYSCVFREEKYVSRLEQIGIPVERLGYHPKTGNRYRVAGTVASLATVDDVLRDVLSVMPVRKVKKASLVEGGSLPVILASQVLAGMAITVELNGHIVEDEVVSVSRAIYSGNVYDLTVDRYHNFVVNGVCVSNCIYGWRGARIENIRDFQKKYPDAKIIKLGKNYRSTPQIVSVADRLIRHNAERIAADFTTDNKAGPPVMVRTFETNAIEAEWVANAAKTLITNGRAKPQDIAVFYRLNSMSRAIEMAMMAKKVPHKVLGSFSFYDRREIKDILCMLRFLVNPKDGIAFHRIANKPKRNLGDVTVGKIENVARTNGLDIIEACKVFVTKSELIKDGLSDIIMAFNWDYSNRSIPEVIDILYKKTRYEEYLKDEDDGEKFDERKENIDELIKAAAQFNAENGPNIVAYLESLTLMSAQDDDDDEQKVKLMSYHASKGLEFPVVFMIGCEQDILPHKKAVQERDDGLEEERRLCYVGMTRAKEILTMSYCKRRQDAFSARSGSVKYKVALPSQFLIEAGLVKAPPKKRDDDECPNYDDGI